MAAQESVSKLNLDEDEVPFQVTRLCKVSTLVPLEWVIVQLDLAVLHCLKQLYRFMREWVP